MSRIEDVTVVLVSYNTRHLLEPCLAALNAALAPIGGGKVVVVDNASRDESADFLAGRFPEVTLIRSKSNVGFGRANNMAVPSIDTPFVLLLNTDAFVQPDALVKTLTYMKANASCGILGVRLEGRDGVLQPSCRYFPTPLNGFLARFGLGRYLPEVRMVDDLQWGHNEVRDCDWVPGCFYLVRKQVIEQVGLFDPRFFLYFEEVDHCWAARKAAWRVVYFPDTTVVHWGGESAGSDGALTAAGRQLEALQIESALLYFRKNLGLPQTLLHLALEMLTPFLITARQSLVHRARTRGGHWQRLHLTLSLARRTSLGTKPTR